jgi:uncharacterized protein (DUF2267 family)
MTSVPALTHSLQKTQTWLAELAQALAWDDTEHAYVALRATLHALRDRLPVDESAELAAQLPLVVRGIYFEGWNPSGTPERIRDRDRFLAPIERALLWRPAADAETVARAVLALLCRHVSPGEIDDVLGTLPEAIRGLFPAAVVADWESRHAAPVAAS